MVDVKKVEKEITWWKEFANEHYGADFDDYVVEPLMEAFGDDVNEILDYLNEMDIDDLDEISGIFEDIYGKFMTEEVWNALEALEKKMEDAKAE
jgi:hypothetical protein